MKPFEWTDELALEFSVSPYATISPLRKGLEDFKASKQRKPIFTTEDGVDIFDGDGYFIVNKLYFTIAERFAYPELVVEPHRHAHYSTREAAQAYVDRNEKRFSQEDIISVMRINYDEDDIRRILISLNKLHESKNH